MPRTSAGSRSVSGIRFADRNFGSSLQFSGLTNQSVNVTDSSGSVIAAFNSNTWSISMWLNRQGPNTGTPTLFGCGANHDPELYAPNSTDIGMQQRGVAGPLAPIRLPLGRWIHAVYTYDGTTLRAYLNGNLSSLVVYSYASGGSFTASAFVFAGFGGGSNQFFGLMDELSLYSVTLNPTQILGLYFNGVTPSTGLVGLYHLDEGTGTTAHDSSSLGQNGTIQGAPLPLWSTNVVSAVRTAVPQPSLRISA